MKRYNTTKFWRVEEPIRIERIIYAHWGYIRN